MEETNKTNEEKLNNEQLTSALKMYQQKAYIAEQQLAAINFATVRLEYLFKVLNCHTLFPEEFIKECSEEIMKILDIKDNVEETKE